MEAREAQLMKCPSTVLFALALVAGALTMAGCRSRGQAREAIQRREELFAAEDRQFALEDQVELLQRQLASCRAALSARSRGAKQRRNDGPNELVPPKVEGLDGELDGDVIKPPVVDEGTEFNPSEPAPADNGEAGDDAGPLIEGLGHSGGVPAKLAMNRQLTGGYDADGRAGHEGVLIAFEPRDELDRLVDVDGAVDIAVVNPALGFGPEADVARWHFSIAEAASYKKNTPFGHGYQFDLPWPTQLATGGDFRVFVRLTTPDRQTFTARHDIQVVAPGTEQTAEWSTAPEERRHWTAAEQQHRLVNVPRPDWMQARNPPPIRIVGRLTPAPRGRVADDSDHEERSVAVKKPTMKPVKKLAKKPTRPQWSPYR